MAALCSQQSLVSKVLRRKGVARGVIRPGLQLTKRSRRQNVPVIVGCQSAAPFERHWQHSLAKSCGKRLRVAGSSSILGPRCQGRKGAPKRQMDRPSGEWGMQGEEAADERGDQKSGPRALQPPRPTASAAGCTSGPRGWSKVYVCIVSPSPTGSCSPMKPPSTFLATRRRQHWSLRNSGAYPALEPSGLRDKRGMQQVHFVYRVACCIVLILCCSCLLMDGAYNKCVGCRIHTVAA